MKWTSALTAVVLVAVAGCSNSGADPERVTVSGQVTWQGQALEKGSLRILPEPGTDAPPSGADIVDGNYVVRNKGGVSPGQYRVEITADRVIGKPLPGEDAPVTEQFLPEKYNAKTTLTLSVPEGTKTLKQDYALAP